MSSTNPVWRRWWPALFGVLAMALAGGAGPRPAAAAATAASPAAGTARIWFYRDYEPYESLGRPYVRLNGHIVGISEPGGAFYRDVPAGRYTVTVDSFGTDVYQFPVVDLVPGQVLYTQVQVSKSWASGGDRAAWERDTFYVRVQPPEIGAAGVATHTFYGGS